MTFCGAVVLKVMDQKTENPEGTAQVDFVTFIAQSYFDTLLRHAVTYISVEQLFSKLWTKRHSLSPDEVIRCV